MSSGEKNLKLLLRQMQPSLKEGEYVFCTSNETDKCIRDVIATFREEEGLTFILEKKLADHHQLEYQFVCRWITLTVHSSLEAVGLTAAVATALSAAGISCNVVAAFYHDHIFVPAATAAKAMQILTDLSSGQGLI